MKTSTLKEISRTLLVLAIWIAGFWIFRHGFMSVLAGIQQDNDVAKKVSGFMVVIYYCFRILIVVPSLLVAALGMKMLEEFAPDPLLDYSEPSFFHKGSVSKKNQNDLGDRIMARIFFTPVLISVLIPARWVHFSFIGSLMVLSIGICLLSIEWVGATGISQSFKSHYGFNPSANLPDLKEKGSMPFPIFFGTYVFIMLMLFLGCHIPFYAAGTLVKIISFSEARHQLLMLHALVCWTFMPLYILSIHSRRVLWGFIKLNLWFIPWPMDLKLSGALGGGTSGGAGASRSF